MKLHSSGCLDIKEYLPMKQPTVWWRRWQGKIPQYQNLFVESQEVQCAPHGKHVLMWSTLTSECPMQVCDIARDAWKTLWRQINLDFEPERDGLRRVMGLLTGHCTLRKNMHEMRIFNRNPHCKLCGLEEKKAWHVMHLCESSDLRKY